MSHFVQTQEFQRFLFAQLRWDDQRRHNPEIYYYSLVRRATLFILKRQDEHHLENLWRCVRCFLRELWVVNHLGKNGRSCSFLKETSDGNCWRRMGTWLSREGGVWKKNLLEWMRIVRVLFPHPKDTGGISSPRLEGSWAITQDWSNPRWCLTRQKPNGYTLPPQLTSNMKKLE